MIDKVKNWLDTNLPSYPQGISETEVGTLICSFEKLFNAKISESYVAFLREINGFSCDSLSLFSFVNDEIKSRFKYLISNDFIYRNKAFRDSAETNDYVIFGDSSLNYIALDVHSRKYILLSNAFLDVLNEFDDFYDLLETFLDIG